MKTKPRTSLYKFLGIVGLALIFISLAEVDKINAEKAGDSSQLYYQRG